MSEKTPISNVQITPARETVSGKKSRPGSINIRFRKPTIAEQIAVREGRSRVRIETSQPPSKGE